MVITFLLTVLVDLTVAIQVGWCWRPFSLPDGDLVPVDKTNLVEEDIDDFLRKPEAYDQREDLPPGVEVFRLRGPLFFGAASRVRYLLDAVGVPSRVFILRMRDVPMIDASGAEALGELVRQCRNHGTKVIVTGVQPEVAEVLARMGLGRKDGKLHYAENYEEALAMAQS